MFVRHAIAIVSLVFVLVLGSPARAGDQEPTFVLTVQQTGGGNKTVNTGFNDALKKREADLKTKLLPKTKDHPASRLSLQLKVVVASNGMLKVTSSNLNYRDAKGPITDDSIKKAAEEVFVKTKPFGKPLVGATVDVTIAILQP